MNTPHPPDREMDSLLRRHLPADAESGDDCLDADTLAAWADGELDEAALAQAETHAADCGRCQALMAAVVRSEPPPQQAAVPWWGRLSVRWLVPLAGAAAATLIWMVAPGTGPDAPIPASELTQARVETPPPVALADEAPVLERREQAIPEAKTEAPEPARKKAQDEFRTNRADTPPATGKPSDEPETADARQRLAKETLEARPAEGATADRIGTTTLVGRLDERAAVAVESAAAPAAAAPPPPASPPSQVGGRASAAEQTVVANRVVPSIRSGDPTVRWRLLADGVVERSADAGASWTRLDTSTQVVLTAGHAPSALVCWVVGRNGVVLVTTDAQTLRQVARPVTEHLVSVDATDARTAAVHTADGRTFRTTDGGASWTMVPVIATHPFNRGARPAGLSRDE